ncbi:MAG: site-specific DNA-methyltransferase [Anaerolineales bacterium]|nr:site-specific DNA-methyltransferase [Anaerolineales bacterium]
MKIKANYFEKGVFPVLMKDIDSACKPFPKGFREELFDKLYDFFRHYFSESGSIYFRNTAQHHNIYEKVYTDDRDVMLFWKTHMLYYVKTDRLFNSMEVEVDGEKFFFDVSDMELKRSNEKRELTYAFKSVKNGVITLTVGYSERGRKTKIDEIVKAVKDKGMTLAEETLEKAFAVFQKQSEVDYFINKNAKAFLQEQFDLWMYQYIFKGESEFNETRLKQLQAIKGIAYKIIDFIAQFEDELVKIWNKPKFVLNSHYIVTLDKILGAKTSEVSKTSEVWRRLAKHKGMKDQLAEWIELGMVDTKFKLDMILEKDVVGEARYPHYQYLPLDTKYFKDLELDILALFDDLDSALDGWLIHSENYQALNTLLPKFRETVDTIFIDPPYNTESDGFIYKDKYRHSSWMTLMENRLRIAKEYMKVSGALFVSIDDNEVSRLRLCGENVFSDDNFVANVIWQKKYTRSNDARWFSDNHDHILVFAKNKQEFSPFLIPRTEKQLAAYTNPDNHSKGLWKATPLHAKSGNNEGFVFKFKNGVQWSPPPGTFPRFSKETLAKLDEGNEIWFGDGGKSIPSRKTFLSDVKEGVTPVTIWEHKDVGHNHEAINELKDVFPDNPFANPKPTRLIKLIIELSCSPENGYALDFFGGSGTTAHAVMNLNRADGGRRKYILVEMGEHFNTVILPRVKKVAFSSKWKDGVAQTSEVSKTSEVSGMSHFAKYFELEQYEDALKRARYEDAPLFAGTQDVYTSYAFLRDLKMLEAVNVNKEQNQVEVSLSRLYAGIDLAETLSCLTGKWIKRITKDSVEFQDGTSASLSAPEWDDVKPLIWW